MTSATFFKFSGLPLSEEPTFTQGKHKHLSFQFSYGPVKKKSTLQVKVTWKRLVMTWWRQEDRQMEF